MAEAASPAQSVNGQFRDLVVDHQVAQLRHAEHIAAELIRSVDGLESDFLGILRSFGVDDVRDLSLPQVRVAIDDVVARRYGDIREGLERTLTEYAEYESDWLATTVVGLLPVAVLEHVAADAVANPPGMDTSGEVSGWWSLGTAAAKALALGATLSGRSPAELLIRLANAAGERYREALANAAGEDISVSALERRIRGTVGARRKDGVTETARNSLRSLVRTAVNHVATRVRNAAAAMNPALVAGVMWVSVLDGRTTLVCGSRDGNVYPVNSGPRPPAHWGCRSMIVLILRSWRSIGVPKASLTERQRDANSGLPADAETYSSWLGRQPAAIQDDILGPRRGRLLRDGGYTVDRFVDIAGRALSLAELKRRDSAVFAALGLG